MYCTIHMVNDVLNHASSYTQRPLHNQMPYFQLRLKVAAPLAFTIRKGLHNPRFHTHTYTWPF